MKRWQWHSSRADNVCAGCEQPIEGISHPLRSCKHEDMIEIRLRCWKAVEHSIMSCKREYHESLFDITRHMRESDGGDVACCGSFLPKFVSGLKDNSSPISEDYKKSLNRVLKTVVKGTRIILREAAELQKGLAGINWRQTAITQFFKPVDRSRTTRKRRVWTDAAHEVNFPSTIQNKQKNKNKIDANVITKNKNIKIDHIFENVMSGGIIYWEFKAG